MHDAWLLLCSSFKNVALNSHGNKILNTAYQIWECTANNWYLSTVHSNIVWANILLFHFCWIVTKVYLIRFPIYNSDVNKCDRFWFSCFSFRLSFIRHLALWSLGPFNVFVVCKWWPSASQIYLIYSTAVILQICFIPFFWEIT